MKAATHLLDTSVYAQPLRPRKSRCSAAEARWAELGDRRLAVSVISDAEVITGILRRGSKRLMDLFEAALKDRLQTLPIDGPVAERFAALKARQLTLGESVSDLDLLIAACARANGLIVATLNVRDFSRIEGLAWEDWSRAP